MTKRREPCTPSPQSNNDGKKPRIEDNLVDVSDDDSTTEKKLKSPTCTSSKLEEIKKRQTSETYTTFLKSMQQDINWDDTMKNKIIKVLGVLIGEGKEITEELIKTEKLFVDNSKFSSKKTIKKLRQEVKEFDSSFKSMKSQLSTQSEDLKKKTSENLQLQNRNKEVETTLNCKIRSLEEELKKKQDEMDCSRLEKEMGPRWIVKKTTTDELFKQSSDQLSTFLEKYLDRLLTVPEKLGSLLLKIGEIVAVINYCWPEKFSPQHLSKEIEKAHAFLRGKITSKVYPAFKSCNGVIIGKNGTHYKCKRNESTGKLQPENKFEAKSGLEWGVPSQLKNDPWMIIVEKDENQRPQFYQLDLKTFSKSHIFSKKKSKN